MSFLEGSVYVFTIDPCNYNFKICQSNLILVVYLSLCEANRPVCCKKNLNFDVSNLSEQNMRALNCTQYPVLK